MAFFNRDKFVKKSLVKVSKAEKEFDLNIEKILDNWEVYHAVREIIANAIDEQILTNSREIEIKKIDGVWHIRDFGRGINYHHLTQNENEEKINNDRLIGRFGVGLKDALATFYRNNIRVVISSKYGVVTLNKAPKIGFDDVVTLHAMISESNNPNMLGTDFSLFGCSDSDVESAKSLFLKFSYAKILETTKYGQIIEKGNAVSKIYINGVLVAEEPNFLFSYNITSLNKQLKMALNRERSNVGRSAYAERIKSILLSSNSGSVAKTIVSDMSNFSLGTNHDELTWIDVELHAAKRVNQLYPNAVFTTAEETMRNPDVIDGMRLDNKKPIIISSALSFKIAQHNRNAAPKDVIVTAAEYTQQKRESFSIEIIKPSTLSDNEKNIYLKTDVILNLVGGKPSCVKEIVIVKSLYNGLNYMITGLWESSTGRILILRSQLSSLETYAGTLLHECAHATSRASDISREFETQLTNFIGLLAANNLKK